MLKQQFERLTYSGISGSTLIFNSPKHFVDYYALPHLWVPRFEEQEASSLSSLFTEIIASISDIKFSKDGQHILSLTVEMINGWHTNRPNQATSMAAERRLQDDPWRGFVSSGTSSVVENEVGVPGVMTPRGSAMGSINSIVVAISQCSQPIPCSTFNNDVFFPL